MSKFILVLAFIISIAMIFVGTFAPDVDFLSEISGCLYVVGWVLFIICCIAKNGFKNVLGSLLFEIVSGIALLFIVLFVLRII